MTKQEIISLLKEIPIPNSQYQFADFKINYQIELHDDQLNLHLSFPFPIYLLENELDILICQKLTNCNEKNIKLTLDTLIETHKVQQGINTINGVKNIIAIASGKGGVGKSTTTTNLAYTLSKMGAKVGVLDADLYGPSQPTMFGIQNQKPQQHEQNFLPITDDNGIQIMSIGLMIKKDQAIVWRGPLISQALQQLLFQTEWNELDYLFIDMPPGTGDIQLTISQKIPVTASVIVTTPQDIALIDAKKAINMFDKVNIPVLGIIENMSMYTCSQCGHTEHIFGTDGGKNLASDLNTPLLAQLPLSINIRTAMDKGSPIQIFSDEKITNLYQQAALVMTQKIAQMSKDYSASFPKIIIEDK